jgi:general secretion pathway protein J
MQRVRGFTLIELLIAISLMALMTLLGWRGLDGISRAQVQLQQHADDVLALQATLAQWGVDLDAIAEQPGMPSLDWDGRTMRMVRRSADAADAGLLVVAWARRSADAQLMRWQSPVLHTRTELTQAWQWAQLWVQTPSDADRLREVRTVALEAWQIYYFRGNTWSNPLSSAGTADATPAPASAAASAPVATNPVAGLANNTLPEGVRLQLTLAPGQAISGMLTRDWVRGQLGGGQ